MKAITWLNLAGVLLLALLCVCQWHRDRELNLTLIRQEKIVREQQAVLVEKEMALRALDADLAQFKRQFQQSTTESTESLAQLRRVQRELEQVSVQRNQLQSNLTHWTAAVAHRDQRLKQSDQAQRQLAEELEMSLRKFNELATRHNALVQEVNSLRSAAAKP